MSELSFIPLYTDPPDLRTLKRGELCGWGATSMSGNATKILHCMFVYISTYNYCRSVFKKMDFIRVHLCGNGGEDQKLSLVCTVKNFKNLYKFFYN